MRAVRSLLATGVVLAGAACASAGAPMGEPAAPTAGVDAAVSAFPTTPPQPGPAPDFTMPAITERSLPNGMRVLYVPRGQLPLVQAVLVTRGGQADDPADRPGLAAFTAGMLDDGAGGRSALELAAEIEQLGASLATGAGWDAAQVSLQVLRNRLPEALALMADVAIRPDFPAAEVDRVRAERLTALARARDEAGAIAANAFAALVFGDDHPYGRLATQEVVAGFDAPLLRDFHQRFYRPGASTLILVGAVDESLHDLVERSFGGWTDAPVPAVTAPAPPADAATRIYLVDRPGSAQSEVRIGHTGVHRATEDFDALQVLNTLLGGSFTSRLNQNLRETHGYTYGAGSTFAMRRGTGPFQASAAVVTAMTDSSVVQFFHELNRIRDEAVPAAELERAKQYVALRLPQQLETTGQLAARLTELVTYDLPLDYYDNYIERILAVDAADVERVAREYVRPDEAVVVVVGDRSIVEAGLRALPFGEVEVRAVEEFVR